MTLDGHNGHNLSSSQHKGLLRALTAILFTAFKEMSKNQSAVLSHWPFYLHND